MSTGEAQPKVAVPVPTGTVTFLFTDVEGSTQRWESQREAMQDAVRRHDALLHALIGANSGYVFKTVGDAFCAAFDSVADAMGAAAAAQQALAKEDFNSVGGLPVRMALHTGGSEEREGDYFGPTVNRVARLLSIGHGGQILLSDATSALARAELPARCSLRDLGRHRLKDLSNPEHVFQLVVPDLPADFPALRSLDAVPNNLPLQVTSFRGREADVADMGRQLHETRLLTVFGAGGVGKSRLATQAGAELLDRFTDGIWRFEFASINDPSLVPSVVAQVLNVEESPGRSTVESVTHLLKLKRALLIFDNCEHLIDPIAQIVSAILHGCPDVRVIATSRQPLAIAGESIYRIPSLGVPSANKAIGADAALTHGAVALFADRARAANNQFVLTDDNAPIVAEICRRLDGIALAIELAAARVKILSVPHLAERLNERFRILTGGDRTALKRQQTMKALIDWSYELLSPDEKLLFDRLAIFAGGWTLDAASEVCAGDGVDDLEILDLLSSLVDKSLVVVDTAGDRERFRLLESTGQYAAVKLDERGARQELARRHAHFYRAFAVRCRDTWATTPFREWLPQTEAELDNFRAALTWALGSGNDAALAGEIAGSLRSLWYTVGLSGEGRKWAEAALAKLGEAHPDIRAMLILTVAWTTDGKTCYDACMQARELFESVGNRHDTALSLGLASTAALQMGDMTEAHTLNERAIEIFQSIGTTGSEFVGRFATRAQIKISQGDYASARAVFSDVLVRYPAASDERTGPVIKSGLAQLECIAGNPELAVTLGIEVLEIDRRNRRRPNVIIDMVNLAVYYLLAGKTNEARSTALDAARLAREIQHSYLAAVGLGHVAHAAALDGKYEEAARLIGYVDHWYAQAGQTREFPENVTYDRLMQILGDKLDPVVRQAKMDQGKSLTEDQAIDEATNLKGSQ